MPLASPHVDFDNVRVERLVKRFGPTRALAGVSARFDAGSVTVVEGPNGSGKSTLLSILGQLALPSGGSVSYGSAAGRQIRSRVRRRIGILAHSPMLYADLTARENLYLFARLYEISSIEERLTELSKRFDLAAFEDRRVRTYSRGQLQRTALARSLIHSPKLLLLDEPSTGLDRAAVQLLVRAIRDERKRGTIQVIVTHDEALASQVSDHRIALRKGKIHSPLPSQPASSGRNAP